MAPTRYAGRFDGPGVDDSEPGPATIAALFTGEGTIIADPVSFPWSLVDDDGWRQPVIVDLHRCTDTDLTALKTVLPVLTPDDRVIANAEQRQTLARELPLPDDAFFDVVPDDAAALFAQLRARKLQRAVLREALGPVVRDELWAAVGIEATRPLTVIEVGADDGWTEALLPKPHSLHRADDADTLDPDSAAIVILHGRAVSGSSPVSTAAVPPPSPARSTSAASTWATNCSDRNRRTRTATSRTRTSSTSTRNSSRSTGPTGSRTVRSTRSCPTASGIGCAHSSTPGTRSANRGASRIPGSACSCRSGSISCPTPASSSSSALRPKPSVRSTCDTVAS